MKKSVFLPVNGLAVIMTAILAGFLSLGNLQGQTQAQITNFNFTITPNYAPVINEAAGTIIVPVYYSADITGLVATFTVSSGATVRVADVVQTSGVGAKDYTSGVTFVVTSGNLATTKSYLVTVSRNAALVGKQLLTFSFASVHAAIGVIDEVAYTVAVHVPLTLDVTALAATFTTSTLSKAYVGDDLQTSGVTVNNYTNPLLFTVKAENASTRIYTVNLIRDPAQTNRQLLSFSFPGVTATINETYHTVAATVPYSTVVTGLVATFTSSYMSKVKVGSTVQVSGTTPNNFTSPVTYRVMAEDTTLYQDYVVTVSKAPVETGMAILSFNFETQFNPDITGIIDQVNKTIKLTVPFSQDVTALVATFTSSLLSTVLIGSTPQVSGVTANNFTNPVSYICRAENGSTEIYTVSIIRAPASSANELLTFRFNDLDPAVVGAVSSTLKTVVVHVPYGTVKTALVASFTVSPLAVAKIGGVAQVSGTTPNDFTAAVVYQIVAENGSIELYTVTVIIDPASSEKRLLTFAFNALTPPVTGSINETYHTVTVSVPFSVSRTALVATFTASAGSSVLIGATGQVSGTTANDFTSAVTYTVKAQDNSLRDYVVTVVNDPASTANLITVFRFNSLTPAVVATIDQTAKTIVALLPYGTAATALVATFTNSFYSIVTVAGTTQTSGSTANNFSTPLTYRCTSESGVANDYLVTVTVAPISTAKDITRFVFEDFTPDVVGVIVQTPPATITANVPFGASRAALKAYFTASPLSTVRIAASGVVQQSGVTVNDFRAPVLYEVTAQDGSIKTYTVTVGEAPDTSRPVVSNEEQTVTNLPGQFVLVRTNKPTGKVYIIHESSSQTTIAHLEAAVAAGMGRAAYVTAANTDIPLSTGNLPGGVYYAYAIDALAHKSLKGTHAITVLDRIPPIVSVDAQTKTNALGNVVNVRSSESNALVYLILENVPQSSMRQLEDAVRVSKGVRNLVQAADVDVPLSVFGLAPGNYHAYAVDLGLYNNMSAPSTNVVVITAASSFKFITAFSFNQLDPPAIGQIVGPDISVKLRVGTPVTNLVATFSLSPLSTAKVGATLQVSGSTENDFTNPVTYTITAEDGTSFDYIVTVSFNTGMDESEWLNSIKSYPNPLSDRLTIEMTKPVDRIQIINGLGQMLEDIHNPGQTRIDIQTNTWKKGLYFVRYYREEQYIGVQKLIKQ